ncbi:MAG: ABC transporter permease [Chloroflexota bacterium]
MSTSAALRPSSNEPTQSWADGAQANQALVPLRAVLQQPSAVVGGVLTFALVLSALLAPVLAPFDPLEMHAADRFLAPALPYAMGTDEFGRDILSRVLFGARTSLGVGIVAISIAASLGVTIGSLSGYVLGWFDVVVMRLCDTILAFPAVLLAIVILAILGPNSLNAVLAIAIVNVPTFARLCRANLLAEKGKDYVEASRALGATPLRLVFRTMLPNTLSTVLVQVTVSITSAVLLESALSFLGLGTPLPAPSWGSMLNVGRGYLVQAPWYGVFPGLALSLLVLGLYLLGDGIADTIDPQRRKQSAK